MNWRVVLEWWLSQLAEWVPPRFRGRLGPSRDALVLEPGRKRTQVYALIKGKKHEFDDVVAADLAARRTALQRFLNGLPERPERIEVRLPQGRFLQRNLELPLAAADNLNEAVGFQLDRLAPFNPEDAIYQCGVVERDAAARRLRAWVTITTREPVEQALQLLGDAAPQPLRPPKAPPGPASPMVLAYSCAATPSRYGISWILAILNLALLGGALGLHLDNRRQTLDGLNEALTQVRREAAKASDLAAATEHLRTEAMAMRERRTQHPLLVAVMDDLSSRLADGTWLQRFETREGTLKLHGVSNAASTLIGQLEASPLLADVRFEAAVTRDAASGGERFSITARMINPGAEPATPPADEVTP